MADKETDKLHKHQDTIENINSVNRVNFPTIVASDIKDMKSPLFTADPDT